MSKAYFNQLQSIIENGIKNNPLPIKKGNSIRIGKIEIRQSRAGYLIFDVEDKMKIDQMLSLRGAIAAGRLYMKNKDYSHVKHLDKQYNKHYMDTMFFKHTIKKSKDDFKKDIVETRLEIAEDAMYDVATNLERIIFDNKR